MYYLTIISPFYNSEHKCERLLQSLSSITDASVEIILVDDGSADNTLALLESFKKKSQTSVSIVSQENKGPGGARNTGLKVAKGKYVWFVDSDDDIKVDALDAIKECSSQNYDFIDFNYLVKGAPTNSMSIPTGSYSVTQENRLALLENFGRICTKVIRKDFIIKNDIYYPEYCVREDSPLTMIYTLATNSFYKSDIISYIHYEDYPSITRSKVDSYWFDRMDAAIFGYKKARTFVKTQSDLDFINEKFISLYLFMTIEGIVSKMPSYSWIITYKVMKKFREVADELDIDYQLQPPKEYSTKTKLWFLAQWYISHAIPLNSDKFFMEQRMKAWGVPFKYS